MQTLPKPGDRVIFAPERQPATGKRPKLKDGWSYCVKRVRTRGGVTLLTLAGVRGEFDSRWFTFECVSCGFPE